MRLPGRGPGTPWAMDRYLLNDKERLLPVPGAGESSTVSTSVWSEASHEGQKPVSSPTLPTVETAEQPVLWVQTIGSSCPAVLTAYYLQANEPREGAEGRDL